MTSYIAQLGTTETKLFLAKHAASPLGMNSRLPQISTAGMVELAKHTTCLGIKCWIVRRGGKEFSLKGNFMCQHKKKNLIIHTFMELRLIEALVCHKVDETVQHAAKCNMTHIGDVK